MKYLIPLGIIIALILSGSALYIVSNIPPPPFGAVIDASRSTGTTTIAAEVIKIYGQQKESRSGYCFPLADVDGVGITYLYGNDGQIYSKASCD